MDTAADFERTPAAGGTAAPHAGSGAAQADGRGSEPGTGAGASVASAGTPSGAALLPRAVPSPAGLVFDDPLDRPSPDDTDRGWGDAPSADDDFTRFLNEKPPHHL